MSLSRSMNRREAARVLKNLRLWADDGRPENYLTDAIDTALDALKPKEPQDFAVNQLHMATGIDEHTIRALLNEYETTFRHIEAE